MPEAMGPNINDLKRYAGLNPDGDDQTLSICMEAAKEWFRNAGVEGDGENSALYALGVYMLAVHYYDNRGVLDLSSAARSSDSLPFGVMSIMHQLRL